MLPHRSVLRISTALALSAAVFAQGEVKVPRPPVVSPDVKMPVELLHKEIAPGVFPAPEVGVVPATAACTKRSKARA